MRSKAVTKNITISILIALCIWPFFHALNWLEFNKLHRVVKAINIPQECELIKRENYGHITSIDVGTSLHSFYICSGTFNSTRAHFENEAFIEDPYETRCPGHLRYNLCSYLINLKDKTVYLDLVSGYEAFFTYDSQLNIPAGYTGVQLRLE